jgi:hypothetical protein
VHPADQTGGREAGKLHRQAAAVLAWIYPPLLLLGLPLLALQLMRVTTNFGLRRAGRTAG